jgi:hypothetical protein
VNDGPGHCGQPAESIEVPPVRLVRTTSFAKSKAPGGSYHSQKLRLPCMYGLGSHTWLGLQSDDSPKIATRSLRLDSGETAVDGISNAWPGPYTHSCRTVWSGILGNLPPASFQRRNEVPSGGSWHFSSMLQLTQQSRMDSPTGDFELKPTYPGAMLGRQYAGAGPQSVSAMV